LSPSPSSSSLLHQFYFLSSSLFITPPPDGEYLLQGKVARRDEEGRRRKVSEAVRQGSLTSGTNPVLSSNIQTARRPYHTHFCFGRKDLFFTAKISVCSCIDKMRTVF